MKSSVLLLILLKVLVFPGALLALSVSDLLAKKVELLEKLEASRPRSGQDTLSDRVDRAHYNALRKLCSESPLKPQEALDQTWLNQLKQELDYQLSIGTMEELGWSIEVATQEDKKMLKALQRELGQSFEVVAFGTTTLGFCYLTPLLQRPLIAISHCENKGMRYFSMYHEMAHIINNDIETKQQLWDGALSAADLAKDPDILLAHRQAEQYLHKALKALDSVTAKDLKRIKKRVPIDECFWMPPAQKERYDKAFYLRATEKRADLFAIEHLLKHNKLFAIKAAISTLASSDYIIEYYDENNHVSSLERALYMIGFMLDNGSDIDHLLDENIEKSR